MSTDRVTLGTSVLVLPWHHPARLAKQVATLDNLSGGRLVVGIGVGVTKDEYAALGVPFLERGRIADEMLAAMEALWTEDVPEFSGSYFRFGGLRFEPKPAQRPHPPIWVGGSSAAARRRVVAHGNGWHPLGLSPEGLGAERERLQAALEAAGRGVDRAMPVAVRLVVDFREEAWDRPVATRRTARGTADEVAALIRAYEAAGATHVIVDAASGDLEAVRALWARFAAEVAGR